LGKKLVPYSTFLNEDVHCKHPRINKAKIAKLFFKLFFRKSMETFAESCKNGVEFYLAPVQEASLTLGISDALT